MNNLSPKEVVEKIVSFEEQKEQELINLQQELKKKFDSYKKELQNKKDELINNYSQQLKEKMDKELAQFEQQTKSLFEEKIKSFSLIIEENVIKEKENITKKLVDKILNLWQ